MGKSANSEARVKVVVVGSINFDITSYLSAFPKPNETVLAQSTRFNFGGKGLNQAVAASRMGADVYMVGCIGDEHMSAAALNHLKENKVNSDHVRIVAGCATGVATISVDEAGSNTIVVNGGANALVAKSDIDRAKSLIGAADVMLLQAEIPVEVTGYALSVANRAAVPTVLNPAPAQSALAHHLKDASYITPNESETEVLTGVYPQNREDILAAVHSFKRLGCEKIVITCGARGCIVAAGLGAGDDGFSVRPPYEVDAIDTTGAGDVFNGVFAYAVARKLDINTAVDLASAAAAISVQSATADTAPKKLQVEAFLKSRHNQYAEKR